jgi:phosphoribosyl-ATP pyrophosphohydrolase/phosphoribosyl-AMP cyclohydrolase
MDQPMIDLDSLDFGKGGGLVTVVAVDAGTGGVLMVAHADRAALDKTLETGEMHYHSRSRGLWHKGATSGNTQRVVSLTRDCDGDAVLAVVTPRGPACHTGEYSCFASVKQSEDAFRALDLTVAGRAASLQSEKTGRDSGGVSGNAEQAPTGYTQRLLTDRNLRLKKIGEEAGELIAACADADSARATEEAADLLYHMTVALRALGISLDDVRGVIGARATPPAR